MDIDEPKEVTQLDGKVIPASDLIGKVVQLHYRSALKCGGVRSVSAKTLPIILRLIRQKDLLTSLL